MLDAVRLGLVKQYFDSIALAKGKEKINVIRSVVNRDSVQRKTLELYLDSLTTFHIGPSTVEMMKNIHEKEDQSCSSDFLDTLIELSEKRGITDAFAKNIACRINSLEDENLIVFCYQILSQSYKLGVTADTYNKAFGEELIPMMKCMLAKKYYEHPEAVTGQRFAITTKFDGIRCIAAYHSGDVCLISRQNQLITGADELENEIREFMPLAGFNVMLDGELLVENGLSMESKEAYKQTVKIVRKDGKKTGICYHIFDLIPAKEYAAKTGSMPYVGRKRALNSMFAKARWNHKRIDHLKPVKWLYSGDDTSMIVPAATEMRKRHQEGVMVNLLGAPYVFGRTTNLLKVKNMMDCDLEIVGFEEGSGKYAGTLGSILVNYKGNVVGVGSGLTDHDRDAFWTYRDQLMGRIITVQYFEETCDASGKPSMRFPVFVELREQGKEVSYD